MLTTAFVNELLSHIANNADILLIGDAGGLRGSVAAGSLYISLHTADPGRVPATQQTTNETTYPGYARQAVGRGAGFSVAAGVLSNAALVQFPISTGGAVGSNVITHWGLGTALAGNGKLLLSGPIGVSNQGPFTAVAATDLLTIPGHSLAVNDMVQFFGLFGVALPAGITEGVTYYVKTVAGNDITLSATQGGATLDITGAGDGFAIKVNSISAAQNVQPEFQAGQLQYRLE